jgi:zinc D-Ala-D-Ala carboxypeptidase
MVTWKDVQEKVGVTADGVPGPRTLAAIGRALGLSNPVTPSPNQRLSENFTLDEFTKSATAQSRNLANVPGVEAVANLRRLVENVLQPIRDRFGSVNITSGYRAPQVNAAVGGARNSQHTTGEAADFRVPGSTQREVADWIRTTLDFDQMILYRSGVIHISFRQGRNRKQVLNK